MRFHFINCCRCERTMLLQKFWKEYYYNRGCDQQHLIYSITKKSLVDFFSSQRISGEALGIMEKKMCDTRALFLLLVLPQWLPIQGISSHISFNSHCRCHVSWAWRSLLCEAKNLPLRLSVKSFQKTLSSKWITNHPLFIRLHYWGHSDREQLWNGPSKAYYYWRMTNWRENCILHPIEYHISVAFSTDGYWLVINSTFN